MPPRLRDHPEDLLALAGSASSAMGIDPAFVDKDFWATELLRAVSLESNGSKVILKGGTSLSKAFGIIERFSEDIDVLLVTDGLGKGRIDRLLKEICERVGEHLGVEPELKESTAGVKRNARYSYPRRHVSSAISENLLLELGTRGGAQPHTTKLIRSYMAAHAVDTLNESTDTWAEFAPVTAAVLRPERTLLEKLSLLHDLSTRASQPDVQRRILAAGRHLYDIHCLLTDASVLAQLRSMAGSGGVAQLVQDIERHSRDAGWPCTSRPAEGFASSPTFDPDHPCQPLMRDAYERARPLVWGSFPDYEACLQTVAQAREML